MKAGNRVLEALAALGVAALVATPVALAAPGGIPGKPAGTPGGKPVGAGKPEGVPGAHGKPEGGGKPEGIPGGGPPVAYVFKGVYEGEGEVPGQGGVAVDHANKHARSFVGDTVTFDLSATKLSVADTDESGTVELADVLTGDRVVVKAKLPKSDPGSQPFAAKQLTDETNPAPDETE